MLLKDLKDFGFPKNLAKVYVSLYKKGESKAKDIIDETDLHRNIVYNNLDKLVKKNLATKKKKGHVTVFQALNPERIREEIKKKEELADNIVEELKTIREPQEQSVIIREGKEELKNKLFDLYEDMKKGGEWKILGQSAGWFKNILTEDEHQKLIELQKEKSFMRKVATSQVIEQEKKHQKTLPNLNTHRILPEFTSKDNEIHIFEDRVISTILVDPFTVMEIKNPKVVDSYNEFFENLWNQDVFTYEGWDEVSNVYQEILPPTLKDNDTFYVYATFSKDPKVREKSNEMFYEFEKAWEQHEHIRRKMLCFSDSERKLIEERAEKLDLEDRIEIRLLPEQYYNVLDTVILNDYVVVTELSDPPKSTVYQSKEVIKGYKKMFELLWKIAKE